MLIIPVYSMADDELDNFVVADNGAVYFYKKLKFGFTNIQIISLDGTKIKIPNMGIKAYSYKGHQFELLPITNCKGDTLGYAFMEFISKRNGSRLFRYCSNCINYDPLNGVIAPLNKLYRYYVVKSGKIKLISCLEDFSELMTFYKVKIRS